MRVQRLLPSDSLHVRIPGIIVRDLLTMSTRFNWACSVLQQDGVIGNGALNGNTVAGVPTTKLLS
jgi:hypothetical protein